MKQKEMPGLKLNHLGSAQDGSTSRKSMTPKTPLMRQMNVNKTLQLNKLFEETFTKKTKDFSNINMVEYLDRVQPKFIHKYKQFTNLNKHSDFHQIVQIITELLDKHAQDQHDLSTSQQFILNGYLVKYLQIVNQQPKLIKTNPFHYQQRLACGNKGYIQLAALSPANTQKSKTPRKNTTILKKNDSHEEIKKELKKVKIMWGLLELKMMTCPNLSRLSDEEENQQKKQVLEMMGKLTQLERNKQKIGGDKLLTDVVKSMKRFKALITAMLNH